MLSYFLFLCFFRINIRTYVAISEAAKMIVAYDAAVVVPIAAPVARFSLISPVSDVMFIINDVSVAEMLMPRRIPIIIVSLMVKLLYTFRIKKVW